MNSGIRTWRWALVLVLTLVAAVGNLGMSAPLAVRKGESQEPRPLQAKVQNLPASNLWSQAPDGIWGGNSQDHVNPACATYIGDDFIVSQQWSIQSILVQGATWAGVSLTHAVNFHWAIYDDAGGVPAGYSGSASAPVWDLDRAAAAAGVTLSNSDYDITLDLVAATGAPLILPPGHYWLVFWPRLNATAYGYWYWLSSSTANGDSAQFIDPTACFSTAYPSWTSWSGFGVTDQDAAFTITGTTACDVWEWANPTPQGNDMRGVAYNNNYGGSPLYVAVGRGGTVMRSTDSVTWTPLALPPVFTDLQGVCWDGTNHQFVAVGNAGVILTSPDGIAWTGWTGPYVRALNAVAYANGYLMAVGNGGYAIWSTDGHTWNDVSTGTANLNGVFGVLYASTTYFQVAGDATGGNAVVLYTTVGSWTWNPLTPSPATGTYNLNAMLYTGGINTNSDWLMVGDNALIYRQYPSPTITQQTVSGSRNFYGIAINGTAANSLRVVVGANGRIVTSTNETAWTNRVSTVAASLYAVIWDGSQFVAVGNEGVVITSPDGITWTRRTAGDTRVLNSVAYSPTANGGSPRFVAVDRQSIQTSDDGGMTWAVQTYPDPQSLLGGVVWANNHFVAVGAAGVILASADGVTWTHYDYTTGPPDLKDVAFGNGVYVAVGGGTSPSPYTTILTSPDGQTWTPAGLPADLVTNPRVLNGVAYVSSGNFFLAVGDAKDAATGTVLWDAGDPTGTWLDLSSRYSISPPGGGPFPAVYNLNAVVEGGPDASNGGAQDYLLVGDHGTLAYSWVGDNYLYPADSGVTNPLNGAQWDGCNYLAVGSVGTILVSQDIQSWARMPEPNRNILYGVAAGPSDYVAVGEGGTALHAARVAANVDPSNPPAAGYPSASYDFDCAPTGGAGSYSYLWDFGDGTTDTNQDTSHAYTTSDTFNWTLTAWDCSGLVGCASGTIVISCPAITLSPSTLPSALIGVPYSEQITASGGSGSYTFAVTAGLPPAGLNLASDGVLSGVPTVTGSAPFTVTATLDGTSCIGSQSYTLGVCPVITVIPSTLPNPSLGIAFVKSFSASGGTGPYIFSYSGTLPTGLSLSPGGMLSGTPTSAGSYSFSVIATDINGCSGGVAFNLTVGAYDAHLWDDQGRSVLCLSTKLKTWSYTILKGTGAGSTYTGVGMISNANGGYVFNASGAMILQAQVFTRDHWGTAVFRYPTKGINSSLYDANTLDDPPECGVKQ